MEYAEYFYDRHDLTYLLLNHFFWDINSVLENWSNETKRKEVINSLRIDQCTNFRSCRNSPFLIIKKLIHMARFAIAQFATPRTNSASSTVAI